MAAIQNASMRRSTVSMSGRSSTPTEAAIKEAVTAQGDSLLISSVVSRDDVLASVGILVGGHDADKFHHASIFVSEDVAVEHERAGEVQEFMPDSHSAGECSYNALGICCDLSSRYRDHILPDIVVAWGVGGVLTVRLRSGNPDHLKRVDVNVEGMVQVCVVLKHPVLQPIQRHALVNDGA